MKRLTPRLSYLICITAAVMPLSAACSKTEPAPAQPVAPVATAPAPAVPAAPVEPTPAPEATKPAEPAPAPTPAPAADPSAETVVAQVGETRITLGELDGQIADEIARQRAQFESALFDTRRQALDRRVSDLVLEAEAKARGVAVDALIEAEVKSKIVAPGDAEVAAFYEQYKGQMEGAPLEQMAPRIKEYLGEQQREKLQRDLMGELRKKHGAKVLLQPPRVSVEAIGPKKGPDSAKVKLVIFSDFECPFCSRALPALEEVAKTYPNDVQFFFRHSPLPFHQAARPVHEASACAGEQGKFWELHDHVFNTRELNLDKIRGFLTGLAGFDGAAYDACLSSGRGKTAVDADLAAAQKYQVDGTPAFFLNGVKVSGAQPFSAFQDIIDAELTR